MKAIAEQLAKALAEAVREEADKAILWEQYEKGYWPHPDWYADAVTALAAYSAEQDEKQEPKVYY
jgi:hypothetical protein